MTEAPRFFFDYVDPLCWLWERILTAHETSSTTVMRHPFELRPPPSEMLDADGPFWMRRWAWVREAVPEPERPPQPRIVPWTRKAHELALHADEKGMFRSVHESLFQAYIEEGQDIGRVDILVELAVRAGLDRSETKAVLDVDRHADRVEQLRVEAERRLVRGVPCLLAGSGRIEDVSPTEISDFLDSL